MHWNHRLTVETVEGEKVYSIREVYYGVGPDPDSIGWTEPIEVVGDSPDEVRLTLERMLAALDKPVLDVDEEAS